jgi:hypothetical protein
MKWEIAITLAVIGLLAVFHAVRAPEGGGRAGSRKLSTARARRDDPWARFLVAAAAGATLLALGVLVVPGLVGGESSTSSTRQTTTVSSASTTTSSTSTTTTQPTTTRPTTTLPTTTTPKPPPRGSTLFVRVSVVGSTGQAAAVVNRVGEPVVVRKVSAGVYRLRIPALPAEARRRTVVRVHAAPDTTAVGGWATSGALVVLTWDKTTGRPAARNFMVVVWGPRSDLRLPGTR